MTLSKTRACIRTGGTWCTDHNKSVDFWPSEKGLAQISDVKVRGGGSACNLAIDIKRLDPTLDVSTIGLLGEDVDGQLLRRLAQNEGLKRPTPFNFTWPNYICRRIYFASIWTKNPSVPSGHQFSADP